ncbi:MAG: UDP-N-acetylglucosamine 2-epimerase (non-hydrolyzing) [Elusimicrobia bacterium]|nr:UDP-N-acetylglucosamine 2-epimerase (non-hydrolyzing) [Elusimicrobiota bacterium]
MEKVITILGTRPEIIRLALIIKKLDSLAQHTLIHTGQNYARSLSEIFFRDLGVRKPDYSLGAENRSVGRQVARIIAETEKLLLKIRPDKVLILGDTNSGLSAIIAERLGVPVYHLEAGNRCYDWKVPEEKNRHIIDSISSWALPYTPNSANNLIKEGIDKKRIFVCGNPINEVLRFYNPQIEKSSVMEKLSLSKGGYFLVTAHRSENVDIKERLSSIIAGLNLVQKKHKLPVIVSTHPRTREKLKKFGIKLNNPQIIFCEPFSLFDFVKLEKNARLVLTDSGTVQEESCIFHVPAVTVRDSTERPETVWCKSNIVSGLNPKKILSCADIMLRRKTNWRLPKGYGDTNVSGKVIKFMLNSVSLREGTKFRRSNLSIKEAVIPECFNRESRKKVSL